MCPGTHSSWILLCSASFTRDWWQSKTNLNFIWRQLRALMAACQKEHIYIPTCVALFCILHYTSLGGIYLYLEYHGVEPKACICVSFLSPICKTQQPCLYWNWTHLCTRPVPPVVGCNPFCYSHLSGTLAMKGLRNAYIRSILSETNL